MKFQIAAVVLPAIDELTPERLQRNDSFLGDCIVPNDGGKRQHGGAGRFVAGRFKAASCLVPAKRNWPRAGGLARRVAPPMVRREQLWLKAIVRARVGCGFTQARKVVSSRSRWSEHGHAARLSRVVSDLQ